MPPSVPASEPVPELLKTTGRRKCPQQVFHDRPVVEAGRVEHRRPHVRHVARVHRPSRTLRVTIERHVPRTVALENAVPQGAPAHHFPPGRVVFHREYVRIHPGRVVLDRVERVQTRPGTDGDCPVAGEQVESYGDLVEGTSPRVIARGRIDVHGEVPPSDWRSDFCGGVVRNPRISVALGIALAPRHDAADPLADLAPVVPLPHVRAGRRRRPLADVVALRVGERPHGGGVFRFQHPEEFVPCVDVDVALGTLVRRVFSLAGVPARNAARTLRARRDYGHGTNTPPGCRVVVISVGRHWPPSGPPEST